MPSSQVPEFRIHELNESQNPFEHRRQSSAQRPGHHSAYLRSKAGIAAGDMMEASFYRGRTGLTPRLIIDRSTFPNADDEYTPRQRKIVDARLAESAGDLKHGRSYGPFDTADEMIAHMKAQLKKGAVSKIPNTSDED